MKTRTMIILLAAVFVLPLVAEDTNFTWTSDDDHMVHIEKFFGTNLNLTDDQEKTFKKMDLDLKKATLTSRNELEVKELEIEAELEEEKIDQKKIFALVDDIYALKANVKKKEIETRLKKRALLDDEQKKVFDALGDGKMQKIIIHKNGMDENIDILMDHDKLVVPNHQKIKIRKEIKE